MNLHGKLLGGMILKLDHLESREGSCLANYIYVKEKKETMDNKVIHCSKAIIL